MESEDFNKCREFLEGLIKSAPENDKYLEAYVNLIGLKSKYDLDTEKAIIEKELRESEYDYNHRTAVHSNNTDYEKSVNRNEAEYHMERDRDDGKSERYRRRREHDTFGRVLDRGLLDR